MTITLSYVMTTYNKLSYLKITLPYLIDACKEDEEIVIVDGGSTDGTKEFLEELYQNKKIHQYISEKDFGEAHGTNKAILLAKGELLKIITDDDIFDFDLINDAKKFLLTNTNVDVLGYDGWGYSSKYHKFEKTEYIKGFKIWKEKNIPFIFCGLSLLIRKKSLSNLGLLSTDFKIIDMEYTIRISSQNTVIAFCEELGFVNIVTPNSNSQKFYKTIRKEQKRLQSGHPSITKSFKINNPVIYIKDKLNDFKLNNLKLKNDEHNQSFDYSLTVKLSIEKLKFSSETKQYNFIF